MHAKKGGHHLHFQIVDISWIQVNVKILLDNFLLGTARTWLDCKNRGLFGFIWPLLKNYNPIRTQKEGRNRAFNGPVHIFQPKQVSISKLSYQKVRVSKEINPIKKTKN